MKKSWGEIFCLFGMFLCGALLVGLVFIQKYRKTTSFENDESVFTVQVVELSRL